MSGKAKKSIRELLIEQGFANTPERAEGLVMAHKVSVAGKSIGSPGERFPPETLVEVEPSAKYVSRGAYKLLGALDAWGVSPHGLVCADVGSSTGGFTQVLLERGARKVYAIDVGYGELAWALRGDPRVVVLERTNARYLNELPEEISLASVDVSFISLRLILPQVEHWLAPQGTVLALVKPQFEAPSKQVPAGGVIVDPAVHREVLLQLAQQAIPSTLSIRGITSSAITGQDGNREFFFFLRKEPKRDFDLVTAVEGALQEVRPPPS